MSRVPRLPISVYGLGLFRVVFLDNGTVVLLNSMLCADRKTSMIAHTLLECNIFQSNLARYANANAKLVMDAGLTPLGPYCNNDSE